MPDLNTTRGLLEKAFIDGWGLSTAIRSENVKFDDSNINEFVSVLFINYTSNNVCVGSAITKRIRHIGVLSIKIYVKQNIGSGAAYGRADQVKNIMDNMILPNLFTKASETRRNGSAEDGWFSLIVDVPFVSDEE